MAKPAQGSDGSLNNERWWENITCNGCCTLRLSLPDRPDCLVHVVERPCTDPVCRIPHTSHGVHASTGQHAPGCILGQARNPQDVAWKHRFTTHLRVGQDLAMICLGAVVDQPMFWTTESECTVGSRQSIAMFYLYFSILSGGKHLAGVLTYSHLVDLFPKWVLAEDLHLPKVQH